MEVCLTLKPLEAKCGGVPRTGLRNVRGNSNQPVGKFSWSLELADSQIGRTNNDSRAAK